VPKQFKKIFGQSSETAVGSFSLKQSKVPFKFLCRLYIYRAPESQTVLRL